MGDETATALAQAAHDVTDAVRDVKRTQAAARRSARELLQRFQALERACAAHGIQLNINTQPEGGHGARRDDPDR